MPSDWLIKNAELVNESRRFQADLCVKDDRFETIAGNLAVRIRALAEGHINVLASDHAPHLEEKAQLYDQAPSGLPLVQLALQLALQRVTEGTLTLPQVVEVASHAPTARFDVKERGYLREGYAADPVLVDPHKAYTVTREEVLSPCGWSPFEGYTFGCSIAATFVNGQRVWNGSPVDDAVRGQRLAFAR